MITNKTIPRLLFLSIFFLAACGAESVAPKIITVTSSGDTTDATTKTPENTPTRLTATPNDNDVAIILDWNAPDSATQFRIYRAASKFAAPLAMGFAGAGGFEVLADAKVPPKLGETTHRFYVDRDVTLGATYYYRVSALDKDGKEGALSNIASAVAGASDNQVPNPSAAPLVTVANRQGSTVILAHDADAGDTHTFAVLTDASHGLLYITHDGVVAYVPDLNYMGSDYFIVRVTDNKGASADVPVFIGVQDPAVAEGGSADINTFKNTPAAYVIIPDNANASRAGFSVVAAPAHGTATLTDGILTYTPTLGYDGPDSVSVKDGTVVHPFTISVVNRAPQPTAAPLSMTRSAPGQTQIVHGDPDPNDPHAYQVVTGSTHGDAAVSNAGVLTFTAKRDFASTSVVVRVTDGSGASADLTVTIVVNLDSVAPGQLGGPLSFAACSDGNDRVYIAAINPPPGATFQQNVTFPVTATLSYSLATTTVIGIEDAAGTITSVTMEPGCGSTEIAGFGNVPSYSEVVRSFPNPSGQTVSYYRTESSSPIFDITGLKLTPGSYIDSPTFELLAATSYDWDGDLVQLYVQEMLGVGDFGESYLISTYSPVTGRPVRLRGAAECGDTFTRFQFKEARYPTAELDFDDLVYPVKPPLITADTFLTGLPVTTAGTYDQTINFASCSGGAMPVTIETSAPWFTVDNTQPTLATSGTQLTVTVHADLLPIAGETVNGYLTVKTASDSVTVAVSAIGIDLNVNDYQLYTGPIALPWSIPFRGLDYDVIMAGSDGDMYLAMSTLDNCEGYAWQGDIRVVPNPTCPVLAPLNSNVSGDLSSTPYYRIVANTMSPHVEIVYWDLTSSYYGTHNVIKASVYPDGTFTYHYYNVTAFGHESVGWYDTEGKSGPIIFPAGLNNGDELTFGPVE